MERYRNAWAYPDFGDVGGDFDDVTNQFFVLDVLELDLVEIDVLAGHSLVGLEEHRISSSHAADAAVKVRM